MNNHAIIYCFLVLKAIDSKVGGRGGREESRQIGEQEATLHEVFKSDATDVILQHSLIVRWLCVAKWWQNGKIGLKMDENGLKMDEITLKNL